MERKGQVHFAIPIEIGSGDIPVGVGGGRPGGLFPAFPVSPSVTQKHDWHALPLTSRSVDEISAAVPIQIGHIETVSPLAGSRKTLAEVFELKRILDFYLDLIAVYHSLPLLPGSLVRGGKSGPSTVDPDVEKLVILTLDPEDPIGEDPDDPVLLNPVELLSFLGKLVDKVGATPLVLEPLAIRRLRRGGLQFWVAFTLGARDWRDRTGGS